MKNYLIIFLFSILFTSLISCNGKIAPHDFGINDSVLDSHKNSNTESNQEVTNENSLTQEYNNENIQRCSDCNKVLEAPTTRPCYICNRDFSGWGFVKNNNSITNEEEIENEQKEYLIVCIPEFEVHNYKRWLFNDYACCSRKCAMLL